MLLRRLRIDATVHGFRSSFRDWWGETGVLREVAEACLARTIRNQEGLRTLNPTSLNVDAQSWRGGPSTAYNPDLTVRIRGVARRVASTLTDYQKLVGE